MARLKRKSFYRHNIGHLMDDSPIILPTSFFIYAACLSLLVILPSLHQKTSYLNTFLTGMLFGFATYATYDP
ncbi:hypothetical protein NEOC65_001852 [Neochlamydia sp. AcF65]|nr:hypothetical protein [Neochlamydia sp. AcF65]MBS4169489.1 hypothetical protein [Neochlamydia sp. AcF95]NGY95199.1 hypothetical protein [Neochlamydia sp. AcF84]